ncbi:glycoside hydrolase family 25 protein [Roseibium aestuarii]|uniref:Glycoside hydrolase family 25 protein n=1 Tax=Roseibium aestuarii TaxID=2600299 RepID=A0ABW4K1J3_9HYPH|nr:GH25 family lysozyme [Roseibium aestuarii]
MAQDCLEGIDVSHYQGTVDWTSVAGANIRFAILKASEGTSFQDPTFHTNWAGAKAAGLACGAYHYFLPTESFMQQADNLVGALQAVQFDPATDLPPAIDCEEMQGCSPATYAYALSALVELVQMFIGVKPMIYASPAFWNALGNPGFGDHPLWIAEYTSAAAPSVPKPWSDYAIWQYTNSGSVPGVNGPVDRNRMAPPKAAAAAPVASPLHWF